MLQYGLNESSSEFRPLDWGQYRLLFKGLPGCFVGGKEGRCMELTIYLPQTSVKNVWSCTSNVSFVSNLWDSHVDLLWEVSKMVVI
jgi:hypothetical protein